MGRDWTPREFHYADIQMGLSKKHIVFKTNREQEPEYCLCDPSCDDAVRYPNIYYLARFALEPLKEHSDILERFEKVLADVIANDDSGKPLCTTSGQFEQDVVRWYEGKLDSAFFFNERNDELLLERLIGLCQKQEESGSV